MVKCNFYFMKKLITKRYFPYFPALIHIIVSVIFSHSVFKNTGENVSGLITVNEIVSLRFETVLAYILTVLTASVLIVMLWKLVFHIIFQFKKSYILFGILYLAGLVFVILSFPDNFLYGSPDNFITYACAVRLTPDYWHNAYSSIIYGACMLVFPSALSVSIIQWSFFLFTVAYIYHRTEAVCPLRFPKYLVFLIFILPNTPFIIHDAYRIFQYAAIMLLYASVILFDMLEKKMRPLSELLTIAFLGAFLGIWRSEGILICGLMFAIYIIFSFRKKAGTIVFFGVLFAALLLLISVPQKIGIKKYYGKDYSVINSMSFLQVLLNCDGDFSYSGAEEDLAAIDAVTPTDLIKGYGISGYRYYNSEVKGNTDFNQSAVPEEEAKAFLSAYTNILIHNIKPVIKNMLETVYSSYTGKHRFYNYVPEKSIEIPELDSVSWSISREMFLSDNPYISKNIPGGNHPLTKLYTFRNRIILFLMNNMILLSVFILILLGNAFLFIRGLVGMIRKKDSVRFAAGLVSLSLLAEYAALFIIVPATSYLYFTIYNYTSLLLFLAALVYDLRSSKDHCTP